MAVKPIPDGYHTVTPYLMVEGAAAAIDFYKKAFGAIETFRKAVAAGATVVMPVADMFRGDRFGKLRDPFGQNGSLATHVRDVSPSEMKAAAAKAF